MILVPNVERLAGLSDGQLLKLAFILDTVYKIRDFSYTVLAKIGSELGDSYLKAQGYFDHINNGPNHNDLCKVLTEIQAGDVSNQKPIVIDWIKQ